MSECRQGAGVAMIRIVVVDDHPMFRGGLVQAVTAEGDIAVVGQGGSAAEAVELVGSLRPDLLLLDARMADSGIDRVGDVILAHPPVRVIIVTASEDEADIARALEAGISAYVPKGMTGSEMRSIVRLVHAGRTFMPTAMLGRVLQLVNDRQARAVPHHPADLSGQEVRVLQALATGLNNREIGARLGITERTVKFHLSNLFTKLKVRNRVEASLMGRRMWPGREE
jgi:DNA-binding NarL/FixJ family response regulator